MVKLISADWIINQSGIPYVQLHLDNVPYKEMLDEETELMISI